jgi:hypothetical protein
MNAAAQYAPYFRFPVLVGQIADAHDKAWLVRLIKGRKIGGEMVSVAVVEG